VSGKDFDPKPHHPVISIVRRVRDNLRQTTVKSLSKRYKGGRIQNYTPRPVTALPVCRRAPGRVAQLPSSRSRSRITSSTRIMIYSLTLLLCLATCTQTHTEMFSQTARSKWAPHGDQELDALARRGSPRTRAHPSRGPRRRRSRSAAARAGPSRPSSSGCMSSGSSRPCRSGRAAGPDLLRAVTARPVSSDGWILSTLSGSAHLS